MTTKPKKGKGKLSSKSRTSSKSVLTDIPPFVHFLVIFILLIALFLIFLFSGNEKNQLYKEAKQANKAGKVLTLYHDVYGDHFVNDLAIDKKRTNFYYDNISTAFTFLPDYVWENIGTCSDKYCGLDASVWHFPASDEEEYCLSSGCLRRQGKELFFNNRPLDFPSELANWEIKNVSLYPLANSWLVGFVGGEGKAERGLAYQFDGQSFSNLDPDNRFPFVSDPDFIGARIGFGGSDDNFLVMYGGYYFSAYQVRNGQKRDVSRFFGLRVADGGFAPLALKKEEGGETIWYVCSLEGSEPRLIKLWQNSSDSIKGALSFSKTILETQEKADLAWCRLDENNNLEVIIGRNNQYYHRRFIDNGFIQKDSVLLTNNIISKNRQINTATFSNLLACDNKGCDNSVLNNSITFSLSGDGENFFAGELDKEIKFPDKSQGIYFSLQAKSEVGNQHYSPWIDGLTAISYSYWQ